MSYRSEREMEHTSEAESWWFALVFGIVPLLVWVLWSWNELLFVLPLKASKDNNVPPGHMGLPFIGELLNFLWYFKFVCRPDDFINAKRKRYGDGVGMYRTYLFGYPSIIACSPASIKFVSQSDRLFPVKWPAAELPGINSIAAANGKRHKMIKNILINVINRPEALKRIALAVQPHVVLALQSWAKKGKVKGLDQTRRVTFESIGKMFVSLDPGAFLDEIDGHFRGLVQGFRAQPFNFPGTAYHHALKCRKKLEAIFKKELEKRKGRGSDMKDTNDLMEGLMRTKDEEGKQLSDDEVVENIVSMVIGGYESTSLASMWGLYYLKKYPDVLHKLQDENLALSRNRKGKFITREELAQLKYTNKVVEEIIRMANISAMSFREVKEDVYYQGNKMPKGWRVMLWNRYLHTDPNNFENPMKFNPDRWDKPPKPGTYHVFGMGWRLCPGNTLARIQLAIFLHHLVVGYKWELINPDAKIMYLPHPKPEDGVEIAFSAL